EVESRSGQIRSRAYAAVPKTALGQRGRVTPIIGKRAPFSCVRVPLKGMTIRSRICESGRRNPIPNGPQPEPGSPPHNAGDGRGVTADFWTSLPYTIIIEIG